MALNGEGQSLSDLDEYTAKESYSETTFKTIKQILNKLPENKLPPLPMTMEGNWIPSVKCDCPTCKIGLGPASAAKFVASPSSSSTISEIIWTPTPLSGRPEWGLMEALREFLLNCRDAEVEFEKACEVKAHDLPASPSGSSGAVGVVLTTPGTHLPPNVFELGKSGWKGSKGVYGRFGEGIQLAAAAILRTPGCSLSILSGGFAYEAFSAGELTQPLVGFKKTANADYLEGVQIQVDGVPKKLWTELKKNFRWLDSVSAFTNLSTKRGKILTSFHDRGCVFVRGFRLPQIFPLRFGYDLMEAPLTRDRTLDPSVDLAFECCAIWGEALSSPAATSAKSLLSDLLSSKQLDSLLMDHVVGASPLALTPQLAKHVKKLQPEKLQITASVYHKIPYAQLSAEEAHVLNISLAILVGQYAADMLDVVEVFDGSGNYKNSAVSIGINRSNLKSRDKTIAVLLSAIADFQVNKAGEKGTTGTWASVMAADALTRIWDEAQAGNK